MNECIELTTQQPSDYNPPFFGTADNGAAFNELMFSSDQGLQFEVGAMKTAYHSMSTYPPTTNSRYPLLGFSYRGKQMCF